MFGTPAVGLRSIANRTRRSKPSNLNSPQALRIRVAPAQGYTFVDIASGGLSFGGFAGPSVNNAGTVAFRAGNTIFAGNGGALTRIADTEGVFDWLSSDFTTLSTTLATWVSMAG
jgi:hypothetical protein